MHAEYESLQMDEILLILPVQVDELKVQMLQMDMLITLLSQNDLLASLLEHNMIYILLMIGEMGWPQILMQL